MLKSIYIKNYVLIDNLEIGFQPGFSVITGETGAGKSIILGALSLILGQRADFKAIKPGESKCIIESTFNVSGYKLEEYCKEKDIEYDPEEFIIRREILISGKSRAFINDSPVSLNDLKLLGEKLIDIHSQHKNLLLGDSRFQLDVLDILSDSKSLLDKYKTAFKDYISAKKQLEELKDAARKSKEDEDYLRFQYNALADAKLIEGEQEELEQEIETLSHSEDIKTALYTVYSRLSDDSAGAILQLKDALNTARSLAAIYPPSESIIQRIESAYLDMKDLAPDVERNAGDIDFNPERHAFIQERLDLIYTLQQKHRATSVRELLELTTELEAKINNIDLFDERIHNLCLVVEAKHDAMLKLAKELSKKRHAAKDKISKQLTAKIAQLGMPSASFKCSLSEMEKPDNTGIDNLEFLFSANKNISLQPISEVASGGEISRVMLCLKSMIAGVMALPTIIFDEIDTGISGEIADKMGQIMEQFGSQMQVIAITHLPQIAARGNTHYYVYKSENKEGTETKIRELTYEERVNELAQMLSGTHVTAAAIQNAKEMLDN